MHKFYKNLKNFYGEDEICFGEQSYFANKVKINKLLILFYVYFPSIGQIEILCDNISMIFIKRKYSFRFIL